MAKKSSGLGRGLGDLLEDNMPRVNQTHRVVLKKEEPVTVSPQIEVGIPAAGGSVENTELGKFEEHAPKPLFDPPIRNRSIKANFKNNN